MKRYRDVIYFHALANNTRHTCNEWDANFSDAGRRGRQASVLR